LQFLQATFGATSWHGCSAAREKLKSFNPGPRLDMRISLVTFSSVRRFLIDVLILFWREKPRSAGTLDTGIVLAILASLFAQSGKICAFTPSATGQQDPIQSERRGADRGNFSREKTGDKF
jgi:hypothetical protein